MNTQELNKLKEITAIQCSDGNYDHDNYMRGMANGMILSVATMEGKEPVYLEDTGHKKEYFKIGSEVKYLRHDTELDVFQEHGILRAIFIDPSNRLMAQVKNGDNGWNVHYCTLREAGAEYDAAFVTEYTGLLQVIRGISSEGDAKVQEVVDNYNEQVEHATTIILGEPLVLNDVAPANEDVPTLEDVAGSA